MSDAHDVAYGKNFKMRDVRYWGGSRKLKNLVNAAARRDRDVYQFGVYTGGSMRGIARSLHGFGHLYGFDSFVGLPTETKGEPIEGPHWKPGAFSAADALASYALNELMAQVSRRVERGNLTLVPGFFNESLNSVTRSRHPFQPALLVDVDVDLHASASQCLTWMFANGLIVPGTYIRYDDWRNMRQRHGEARAHWEVSSRFNVTWRNLGWKGEANSREWQVESIGGDGGASADGSRGSEVGRGHLRRARAQRAHYHIV